MDYYLKQNELRAEALREGIAQGLTQGIAQQKAEDEKLLKETIAKLTAQKDAENARQAAEIKNLLEEIAKLKAKL